MSKCKHLDTELSAKDVAGIFGNKNYKTVLLWLKQDKAVDKGDKLVYINGKFPNAYKCKLCNRIFIPSKDVEEEINNLNVEGRL